MTVTSEPRTPTGQRPRLIDRPLAVIVAMLGMLVAYGWTFLMDPSISAPTRDPAWYTWRSYLLMHGDPKLLVGDWGPLAMFGGGYRISVPLYGAVLQRVAGIDLYTFSAFMMVGIPILAGLALGAFAWRSRRDPLRFLLVLLATGAWFMTTPYVGYLDQAAVLYLLAITLAFVEPARTSWGARVALFLTGIAAAFTHPTTCVIFGFSLVALFGVRFLTSRFRFGPALRELGPSLLSIGGGMFLGLATWLVGPWGAPGSLADAALPPPYTQAVFLKRLGAWILSLNPLILVPLVVLGIGWTIATARKQRAASEGFGTISAALLLPFLGVLGFLAGAVYPYYRFMNATLALFPLAGLGAWVAVRWLLARTGRGRIAGLVGVAVVLASFAWVWVDGRRAAQWADPDNQWIDQPTRTALAAIGAVVEDSDPTSPILFVVDYEDIYQAYGWSKTFTNVSRTGLPGDSVRRSMTAFGAVQDVVRFQPTVRTDATYNRMSAAFAEEVLALRETYTGPPLVFLVRQFNEGSPNADLLDTADPALVPLGDDVAIVVGPGLATPADDALAAARAAEAEVAAFYADHPGPLGNFGHTLRVLLGLALLLVLPGALAARFFGLDDPWLRIALVPGISIVLTVLSAIAVVSVHRAPFGVTDGWASLGLATAIAFGLRVGAGRIEKVLGGFGRFFGGMFAAFSNGDFAALMGVQFLAMMADGLIRGSIAKSIAFGGQQGFDITTVPSADYLLTVALALYVPYTFVSPFIGVFIDRFERRRVLAGTALATAVLTALIAVGVLLPLGTGTSEGNLLATGALIVGMLVMQACVRITLAVKSAALPEVVHGKDLLNGNGLSQAGGALFQVVGAGLAFGLGAVLPAWLVVVAGGAALVVAALVTRRIRQLEVAPHTSTFLQEARRVLRDIASGVREVASRPPAALGLSAFQMLRYQFWGFALMTFALYSRSLVASGNADTVALGIVGGGGFLGGAIGLVLAQRWKDRIPPARLLVGSMAVLGGATLVFGAFTTLLGFSALLFCGFAGFFLGKISADTIMQQAMPDDFRGRAFALFDVAYNLGFIIPALILVVVWADDRVSTILMTSGAVFLGLTLLVARWARSIREQLAPQDDLVV